MDARIRYGNEADIIAGINTEYGRGGTTAYELMKEMGSTVLSFSSRVRNLPDEIAFGQIMTDVGIDYSEDKPDETGDFSPTHRLIIPANRMVRIENPEVLSDEGKLLELGNKLLGLAEEKGLLGSNGVHFVDHSKDPSGQYILSR